MKKTILPQAWKISELSLRDLIRYNRSITKQQCRNEIKVAILGDCATQHYSECLSAALKIRGYWPDIYQSEFNSFNQDLLDPSSEFHKHKADVVVLFNCVQALQERFHNLSDSLDFTESISTEYVSQWTSIRANSNALILQHNLCLPLDFTFGNFSARCDRSFLNSVARINTILAAESFKAENICLIDTESQASYYGKNTWLNEGLWCQAKQALSPLYLAPLVKVVSDAILEKNGFTVKCVVLDLDNTVWGGVLGDVGLNGVEIGEISEMGISFSRFQQSIKLLKDRGMLLTVCSKNNIDNAKEVFQKHPDMILKEDDIVCFMANYEDKVQNILTIQKELNIGLDSFVFLDDSPFERNFVRESLPEVQVPERPEDPAEYSKYITKWNLFESNKFSAEDSVRTSLYKDEVDRASVKREHPDLGSYLKSLEMKAEIEAFNEFTLPRVGQLIQRSNQFNLTTTRHNEAELKGFSNDKKKYITFTIRLEDRIGDNGIISLMIGKINETELVIDSWIMSCRVLGRQIEDLAFSYMIKKAAGLGVKNIVGVYKKTSKNDMVSELYTKLGFTKGESTNEMTRYNLELCTHTPKEISFITLAEKLS
jgi:FkbH-like protein